MRYVTIPVPLDGIGVNKEGKPAPYEFRSFLTQFVWKSETWREDNAAVESFLRCSEGLASRTEGVVGLSDEDHERLACVALTAHSAFDAVIVVPLMQFVHAITSAPNAKPSDK